MPIKINLERREAIAICDACGKVKQKHMDDKTPWSWFFPVGRAYCCLDCEKKGVDLEKSCNQQNNMR